jgi:RNA polymerase sigma-70 factor (ECF subfamily)
MSESFLDSTQLRLWVRRIQAGDRSASDELLRATCDRLKRLTRKMLCRFPSVRRWEQSDDVLQNALLRLLRALQQVEPPSVRHFFSLAAEQIRRELLDLVRHYGGPHGAGAHHDSGGDGVPEPLDQADEPGELEEWVVFHEQVSQLPAEQRQVVRLVFYRGWTHAQVAELLGMSKRTARRHWQRALARLCGAVEGREVEA